MTASATLLRGSDDVPHPGHVLTRRSPGHDLDVGDLATRVGSAVAVGGDRLEPVAVQRAAAAVERVGERAQLGVDHTVVALAGPTGSGKSSLFNALAGFDVSPVGVRRPTTEWPIACVWGDTAGPLLDWLQVPTRHRTERISELEEGREEPLRGLVLLDMPDHDSRKRRHRREVDRLVDLVDVMVWVVDPQKYADALMHTDYLRRFVHHEDVVLVALNQADTLTRDQVGQVHDDLRRLLSEDGLAQVDTLVTSARTGSGVDRLRALLVDAVASRAVAAARARGDLLAAMELLRGGVADDEAVVDAGSTDSPLVVALADAAGVPTVVDAVRGSYRRRAERFTGWPLTRWVRRLRPDPLERLRLATRPEHGAPAGMEPVLPDRTSLPRPTPASQARVDLAVRDLVGRATAGLPPRWADAVRALTPAAEDLSDALDRAVSATDLRFRDPWWWRAVAGGHLALLAAAVGGLAALVALSLVDFLGFPEPGLPAVAGIPLPTLLLLVGVLGGLVLAALAGAVASVRARAAATSAETRMLVAVAGVARERLLDPVAAVLADHRHCRDLLTV